ncbi:MAG: pyrophosphatase [Candidatus Moranbacteria bacterium]|nr:pyrophosphatase [Candidatus Moranbacteria bacterium]
MKKYFKAIQKFHDKHGMKESNNEDMQFRLNLMIEELGELAQAVTKGKSREEIIEENVDLFNLIVGNLISMEVSEEEFDEAFQNKYEKIMSREARNINGKVRISEFR